MSLQGDQTFEFGPFVLDPLAETLSKHGRDIPLPPKAFAVLLVLVRNAGRTVKKDEIIREVWPNVFVEEQNVSFNIYLARKAVGDDAENPTYIATVARRGYRFVAPVVVRDQVTTAPPLEQITSTPHVEVAAIPAAPESRDATSVVPSTFRPSAISWRLLGSALAEDGWFVVTSCTLYALLYAIALFVEVAYQFNSYAASAGRVAPFVFLWIWTTSIAGLTVCRVLTLTGRTYSLPLAIALFVGAGVVLYVSMGWILPNVPITKALFQTYPAHGAYLKSISHFFSLAVIFLMVPYHFVVAARTQVRSGNASQIRKLLTGEKLGTAPHGAVFLRLNWLGVLLIIAAIASIAATAHLMDNLVSSEYTSMFTQLIQWRLVVFFALAVICLWWYSRSLNAIKIAALEIEQ